MNKNYSYDSASHLLSVPRLADGTFSRRARCDYDANGNTSTKADANGTTTYTWDFENRLTSVVLPGTGGTVTFKYDSFGRRIQKSLSSGTTNYLYDSADPVEDLDGGKHQWRVLL